MSEQKQHSLSVLLIDDNAIVRAALGEMLELEGWKVTYCHDGRSAAKQSFVQSFDAMLVDFSMPGLDGPDAVTILRPAHPHTCIIGMSMEDRSDEFLAAGADAFLMKPFGSTEILRLLKSTRSATRGGGNMTI